MFKKLWKCSETSEQAINHSSQPSPPFNYLIFISKNCAKKTIKTLTCESDFTSAPPSSSNAWSLSPLSIYCLYLRCLSMHWPKINVCYHRCVSRLAQITAPLSHTAAFCPFSPYMQKHTYMLSPSPGARQWSMVTGWDAHAQSTAESPQGTPTFLSENSLLALKTHPDSLCSFVCSDLFWFCVIIFTCFLFFMCSRVCLLACVPLWVMQAALTFSTAESVRVSLLLTSPSPSLPPYRSPVALTLLKPTELGRIKRRLVGCPVQGWWGHSS